MSTPTNVQVHAWMRQWHAAGPALARVRAAGLEHVDLWRVADELEQAFWAGLRDESARSSSGLVEQQRFFVRAVRR